MVFPTDWQHRIAITINSTFIDSALTDWTYVFDQATSAVLTQVDGPLDADGARPLKSDLGDIRFSSDLAGTTEIAVDPRYVELNNDPSLGRLELATKIPSVSNSANTTIYMWWGNASATLPAASATYGQYNAYDSNTVAVYPLLEEPDGSAGQIKNRKQDLYHGTSQGGMGAANRVNGSMGFRYEFDGANDTINIGDVGILGTDSWTFQCLSEHQTSVPVIQYPLGKTSSTGIYVEFQNQSNQWGYWGGSASDSVPESDLNEDVEYLLSTTQASDVHIAYRDDGTNSATNTFSATGANSVYIASRGGGNELDGFVDEVRIASAIARSQAWIKADYNSLLNKTNFASFGAIEDVGGAPPPFPSVIAGILF